LQDGEKVAVEHSEGSSSEVADLPEASSVVLQESFSPFVGNPDFGDGHFPPSTKHSKDS
jgi:hypothetical protein